MDDSPKIKPVRPAWKREALFHFLVRGVLPARIAEFVRFEPVLMLFPVLGGRVVTIFAVVTL